MITEQEWVDWDLEDLEKIAIALLKGKPCN